MKDYVLGIVGAGVMGSGIAQNALQRGIRVVLVDSSADALAASRERMKQGLRLERMLNGGRTPAESLATAELTTSLEALGAADFVVESVFERIALKEEVVRAIDACARPGVCIASNSSAIPIGRLAAVTKRPTRVLGIHFMNPVPMKETVELIRGPLTEASALASARDLLERMGKRHVEVRDGAGFVGNRVLMLAVNEAIGAAADERASPAEIDRVFTGCLGHRMGPLATADLIGLDVILDTLRVLSDLSGPRYVPHPLLVEMVGRGDLGLKTGRGFFSHPSV